MASAVYGGYDCTFVEEVPEDFVCVVCSLALKEPIQFENCGHRLCKYCFNQLQDHAANRNIDLLCPYDREVISAKGVFNDKGVARKILNLKVYCGGHSKGCDWTDELRYLETHEKSCSIIKPQDTGYEINDLKSKLKDLAISVTQKDEEIDESKKKIEELTMRCETLENTVEQLIRNNKVSENTILTLKQSNEITENTIQQLTESNKTSKNSIQQLVQSNEQLLESNRTLKNTVDQLSKSNLSVIEKNQSLEDNVKLLENRFEACEKRSKNVYEWIVNFDKLKQSFQLSEPFYLEGFPFCFRLTSNIGNKALEIGVFRCRGKNDKPNGKIISTLSEFQFQIYLVGGNGCVKNRVFTLREHHNGWNIEAGQELSTNSFGDTNFLKSEKLGDWIINNNLHIYLKIE